MTGWRPISEAPTDRGELRIRDPRGAEGTCVFENGAWRTSKNKFRIDAVSFLKSWADDGE